MIDLPAPRPTSALPRPGIEMSVATRGLSYLFTGSGVLIFAPEPEVIEFVPVALILPPFISILASVGLSTFIPLEFAPIPVAVTLVLLKLPLLSPHHKVYVNVSFAS